MKCRVKGCSADADSLVSLVVPVNGVPFELIATESCAAHRLEPGDFRELVKRAALADRLRRALDLFGHELDFSKASVKLYVLKG